MTVCLGDVVNATPPPMRSGEVEEAHPKAKAAASESIGVYARFKPLAKGDERGEIEVSKFLGQQKSVTVKSIEFSLDWVFDTDSTQEELFEIAARDRINALMTGYNVTLLAYGQTGSGKTHTMFGPDEVLTDFQGVAPELYGLVPRCTIALFEGVDNADSDSTFIVQCSYLEVYNDKLNDMLSRPVRHDLRMRETCGGKGVTAEGLHLEVVTSVEEVMDCLKRGQDQRVVAPMAMNARSSRGHGIRGTVIDEAPRSTRRPPRPPWPCPGSAAAPARAAPGGSGAALGPLGERLRER